MKELNAYLIFNGNCGQAMKFYQQCLGADLQTMPFSEMPGGKHEDAGDRLAHARLTKGKTVLMASDNLPDMPFQQGNNFSVCLDCESTEEVDTLFAALSEKGQVTMAPQETFWAKR
ncbi:MAG TPA: VOC family protein, partial [Candidatus Angelobacter sp.]